MHTHAARRQLAGVAVCGVLATAAIGAPAAAEPAANGALHANNAVVAPDGPRKWVTLNALDDRYGGDYTVRVDRSGVEAFVDVEPDPGVPCTTAGSIITCPLTANDEGSSQLLAVTVKAAAASTPGQRGVLLFTVTAPGMATERYRATVTVGEGVELVTDDVITLESTLGARVDLPLTVTNRGTRTAHGLVLYLSGSYGFMPSKRYENCEYANLAANAGPLLCTFDESVEPGEAVRVDPTFGGTVPADSWAPNRHLSFAIWFTPADWAEFRSQEPSAGPVGPNGSDEPLQLVPVGTQSRALDQTDTDPFNNETRIRLTVAGDQRGDVAAEGATVTGAVGSTVRMRVGYTNNGPASAGPDGQQGLDPWTTVTLPAGVTAVTAPETCLDPQQDTWQPGKPGARVYECFADSLISRGERMNFDFDLRIDRAGSQTGTVRLRTRSGDGPIQDLDPTNDTATIRVNPASGGGAGDGGSLPITGTSTGVIGGVGLLLVVAGAGGFLLARRRRTRFVA